MLLVSHQCRIQFSLYLSPDNIPHLAHITISLPSEGSQFLGTIQPDTQKEKNLFVLQFQIHHNLPDVFLRRQIMHLKQTVSEVIPEVAPADLAKCWIGKPAGKATSILTHLMLERDISTANFITTLPLFTIPIQPIPPFGDC